MKNRTFWAICGLGVASVASAQVKINEYSYDDIGTNDDQEFVELYNAGSTPVDISGWTIECGDEAWPADNNADIVIPSGTIIPAKGYFVAGAPAVPNVNLVLTIVNPGFFENDKEFIALKNAGGTYLDALAVECNKVATLPAQFLEGGGCFGNHQTAEVTASSDGSAFTWARWRDGVDSNNNGRDFGNVPRTPGASNSPERTGLAFSDNFDSYAELDRVPRMAGNFQDPRVIIPGSINVPNPNYTTPSPQGGNAMIFWDWAGGGNVAACRNVYTNNCGFEAWVYFDTSLLATGESEQWSIGVLGTSDPVFNIWNATGAVNGNTGICWNYSKSPTTHTLTLADAGAGGTFATWNVLGTIDMTSVATGWYRLRIDVVRGKAVGYFDGTYGSTNTGTIFTGAVGRSTGNFYMGYREAIGGAINDLCHPILIDDLRIYDPSR